MEEIPHGAILEHEREGHVVWYARIDLRILGSTSRYANGAQSPCTVRMQNISWLLRLDVAAQAARGKRVVSIPKKG